MRTRIKLSVSLLTSSMAVLLIGAAPIEEPEPPAPPPADPIYRTANLTSNRFSALPNETLQIVLFYDGAGTATIEFRYQRNDGSHGWLRLNQIPKYTTKIETHEYDLNGCQLTGEVNVIGVQPDGVVDGLAVGLYWRSASGNYHLHQSTSVAVSSPSDYVGAWPMALSDASFQQRMPQVTDGNGRAQARAAIMGAKLLRNGSYLFDL